MEQLQEAEKEVGSSYFDITRDRTQTGSDISDQYVVSDQIGQAHGLEQTGKPEEGQERESAIQTGKATNCNLKESPCRVVNSNKCKGSQCVTENDSSAQIPCTGYLVKESIDNVVHDNLADRRANKSKKTKGTESLYSSGRTVPLPPRKDMGGQYLCKLCRALMVEVVFIPCCHLCFCARCAHGFKRCPMKGCRQHIGEKIRAIM